VQPEGKPALALHQAIGAESAPALQRLHRSLDVLPTLHLVGRRWPNRKHVVVEGDPLTIGPLLEIGRGDVDGRRLDAHAPITSRAVGALTTSRLA
jgi:hypothetical protein